jgi:hypothetical protein
MPKHPLPPARKAQREKALDANTQLWLLSLEKLAPLTPDFVDDGSDLVPYTLMEHFSVLLVLSRIGLAAQNAQRVYGVPASLLIGKYLVDYAFDPEHSGDEAEQLFLEEAEAMRRSFPAELDLLSSPVEYAIALQKHGGLVDPMTGESDELYCRDVACRIVEHGLLECDYRYGTGGLYDLSKEVCPEDVAVVLGCSAERVSRLIESGDPVGHYTAYSLSEKRSIDWRAPGPSLRAYVQQVQLEKFSKPVPTVTAGGPGKRDTRGLRLVQEKPTVAPSVPVDAC